MSITQNKRIEFPLSSHTRVADLLRLGLAVSSKNGDIQSIEDKQIHDCLSDFYGEKRIFDIVTKEELKDEIILK